MVSSYVERLKSAQELITAMLKDNNYMKERTEELDKSPDSIILEESPTKARKHRAGKLRVDLIPPEVIVALAEAFDLGIKKGYEARNWEQGLLICEDSLASAERHILRYKLGEDINTEMGKDGKPIKLHHLKCALVNMAMAVTQVERGRHDLDDRRCTKE